MFCLRLSAWFYEYLFPSPKVRLFFPSPLDFSSTLLTPLLVCPFPPPLRHSFRMFLGVPIRPPPPYAEGFPLWSREVYSSCKLRSISTRPFFALIASAKLFAGAPRLRKVIHSSLPAMNLSDCHDFSSGTFFSFDAKIPLIVLFFMAIGSLPRIRNTPDSLSSKLFYENYYTPLPAKGEALSLREPSFTLKWDPPFFQTSSFFQRRGIGLLLSRLLEVYTVSPSRSFSS